MPPEFTSDSSMESPDTHLEDNNPSTKTDKGKGSRENKYQCSIGECRESFRRQDQLDRHEYKHTGIVSMERTILFNQKRTNRT